MDFFCSSWKEAVSGSVAVVVDETGLLLLSLEREPTVGPEDPELPLGADIVPVVDDLCLMRETRPGTVAVGGVAAVEGAAAEAGIDGCCAVLLRVRGRYFRSVTVCL